MTALQPDDPPQLGGYRLLRRLGAGGMGRVYLARSRGGRPVALKVIRPDLAEDEAFRARFAREVAAARAVSGVFTAAVVDADPSGPIPWLATEYVPGPALSAAVREQGPLPPKSVRALAAGLAEALEAIHRAGVVHRDLKPSNVLLAMDGPRVIDFGISRAAEATATSGFTRTGMVVGSPGFMSPEQIEGGPVTTATDVFALGAVLAFAATGAGPFGEGATPAMLYRVVHTEPRLDRVPPELRELIGACLVKDPAARPTPDGLLDHLESAADPAATQAEWLPVAVTGMITQVAADLPAALASPYTRAPGPPDPRTGTPPTTPLPPPGATRAEPAPGWGPGSPTGTTPAGAPGGTRAGGGTPPPPVPRSPGPTGPTTTTRHQGRRIALLVLVALLLLALLGYAIDTLVGSSGGTPAPSTSGGTGSSAALARITVPNVLGDSESTARRALLGAGFTDSAISVQRTCSGYSAGRTGVLDQSPRASAGADRGSRVALTLEAADCRRYPDETGRPDATARSDLNGHGFTHVGTRTAGGCSGSDPAGRVESQSPSPGGNGALRPSARITLTLQPSGCSAPTHPPTTAPTTPSTTPTGKATSAPPTTQPSPSQ
jgi:serine/threonine protein kinase